MFENGDNARRAICIIATPESILETRRDIYFLRLDFCQNAHGVRLGEPQRTADGFLRCSSFAWVRIRWCTRSEGISDLESLANRGLLRAANRRGGVDLAELTLREVWSQLCWIGMRGLGPLDGSPSREVRRSGCQRAFWGGKESAPHTTQLCRCGQIE